MGIILIVMDLKEILTNKQGGLAKNLFIEKDPWELGRGPLTMSKNGNGESIRWTNRLIWGRVGVGSVVKLGRRDWGPG